MSGKKQDAVDECPFFRDDPFVVFVVVSVVEEGVERWRSAVFSHLHPKKIGADVDGYLRLTQEWQTVYPLLQGNRVM